MMNNKNNSNIIIAIILIIAAVTSRIINIEGGFWLNFNLLGAVSLFSGNVIRNKPLAFLVPLGAYLLTDVYLAIFTHTQGFYGISQFITYAAMILVVLLGSRMPNRKPISIFGYTLGASFLFWVVSNFGVWFGNLFTNLEPSLTLGFTYWRALPFYNQFSAELFAGTFVGDMVFSFLLFGAFALFSQRKLSVNAQ